MGCLLTHTSKTELHVMNLRLMDHILRQMNKVKELAMCVLNDYMYIDSTINEASAVLQTRIPLIYIDVIKSMVKLKSTILAFTILPSNISIETVLKQSNARNACELIDSIVSDIELLQSRLPSKPVKNG